MRRLLIPLLAGVAVAGCGSSKGHSSTRTTGSAAAGTQSTGSASAGACRAATAPAPRTSEEHLKAPPRRLDPARTYTVTVATNCGTFAFVLDVKDSPKTSASLYHLIKRGFYDGLAFHRVVPGFVIQGGDPAGNGSGGPGYTVVDPPPSGTQYVAGDVAMAKTQDQPAGASGSQFFVVTGANVTRSNGLTPDYALAGKVVSGMDVVQRIGALPTNPPGDGAPTQTVVMSRVTVAAS
jgi:peptidyl-prolyl cis-trans isomerase B (cyclophilin B)